MEGVARAIDPLSADWVAGVLLSCMLVLAAIHMGAPRIWRLLRGATFRLRLGRQALREDAEGGNRDLLGLQAVAAGSLGLLLWQAARVLVGASPPAYMYVALGTAAVMAGQSAALRLAGWLARADAGIAEFRFTGMLLWIALGIGLLPVLALSAYHPEWRVALLRLGLGALALGFGYRWLRAMAIGMGEGVPLRYVLLYLCAAEILPLALALRALR